MIGGALKSTKMNIDKTAGGSIMSSFALTHSVEGGGFQNRRGGESQISSLGTTPKGPHNPNSILRAINNTSK